MDEMGKANDGLPARPKGEDRAPGLPKGHRETRLADEITPARCQGRSESTSPRPRPDLVRLDEAAKRASAKKSTQQREYYRWVLTLEH